MIIHLSLRSDYGVFTDLDILAFKISHLSRESSGIIYGTRWYLLRPNDTVGNSDTVVIVAKRRCLVNNASAIITSNVFINDHSESSIFELNHIASQTRLIDMFKLTCSVKYSKRGTYRQPFMSEPWN